MLYPHCPGSEPWWITSPSKSVVQSRTILRRIYQLFNYSKSRCTTSRTLINLKIRRIGPWRLAFRLAVLMRISSVNRKRNRIQSRPIPAEVYSYLDTCQSHPCESDLIQLSRIKHIRGSEFPRIRIFRLSDNVKLPYSDSPRIPDYAILPI